MGISRRKGFFPLEGSTEPQFLLRNLRNNLLFATLYLWHCCTCSTWTLEVFILPRTSLFFMVGELMLIPLLPSSADKALWPSTSVTKRVLNNGFSPLQSPIKPPPSEWLILVHWSTTTTQQNIICLSAVNKGTHIQWTHPNIYWRMSSAYKSIYTFLEIMRIFIKNKCIN